MGPAELHFIMTKSPLKFCCLLWRIFTASLERALAQTLLGGRPAGPDCHPMFLNAGIPSTSTMVVPRPPQGLEQTGHFVCEALTAQE